MQKKLEIVSKEKSDLSKQMKQLYVIFTKQRKALELSIKKTKKLEIDSAMSEKTVIDLQNSSKIYTSKLNDLEAII